MLLGFITYGTFFTKTQRNNEKGDTATENQRSLMLKAERISNYSTASDSRSSEWGERKEGNQCKARELLQGSRQVQFNCTAETTGRKETSW